LHTSIDYNPNIHCVIYSRQKRDLASRNVDISAAEANASDDEHDAVTDAAERKPNICLV